MFIKLHINSFSNVKKFEYNEKEKTYFSYNLKKLMILSPILIFFGILLYFSGFMVLITYIYNNLLNSPSNNPILKE